MTQFPSAGHLVSLGGACAQNWDERCGQAVARPGSVMRPSSAEDKIRWSRPRGRATREEGQLPAIAVSAHQRPRGPKKAIIAVAASMLTAVYFMLRTDDEGLPADLGGRYLAVPRTRSARKQRTPAAAARSRRRCRSEGRLNQ